MEGYLDSGRQKYEEIERLGELVAEAASQMTRPALITVAQANNARERESSTNETTFDLSEMLSEKADGNFIVTATVLRKGSAGTADRLSWYEYLTIRENGKIATKRIFEHTEIDPDPYRRADTNTAIRFEWQPDEDVDINLRIWRVSETQALDSAARIGGE